MTMISCVITVVVVVITAPKNIGNHDRNEKDNDIKACIFGNAITIPRGS